MLDNWFSIDEIFHILRRIRRDPVFRSKLTGRLRLTRKGRIMATWAHSEAPPTGWWDIPAVQGRWNKMISGDENIDHRKYVAMRYGKGATRWRGLSLGCGTGRKEIQWARTGIFASIDAYDQSRQRILAAIESIAHVPEAEIIRYRDADVLNLDLPNQYYDVVMFEHSLHHFSPLEMLLQRVKRALKPGGLLVADEFVGPTRFQWTNRQLAAVNGLLQVIPREYTLLLNSRFPRLKSIRPSKLSMWLSDPSEAIESSNIIPLLQKHFQTMEIKGYGGSILHLLLSGVAHHFINPDVQGQRLLDLCFAAEDLLLDSHEIDHDFALIICRA